jgi:hypothetical protein
MGHLVDVERPISRNDPDTDFGIGPRRNLRDPPRRSRVLRSRARWTPPFGPRSAFSPPRRSGRSSISPYGSMGSAQGSMGSAHASMVLAHGSMGSPPAWTRASITWTSGSTHSPRASTLISTATRAERAMARRFRPLRTQTSATSKASQEVVYDTIADLRAHLEWSGERASSDTFKLLALDAPAGTATVARRSPRAGPRTTARSTIVPSSRGLAPDPVHDRDGLPPRPQAR